MILPKTCSSERKKYSANEISIEGKILGSRNEDGKYNNYVKKDSL